MEIKNYALEEYYEELALDTVLSIAAEQGIKLRRGDFWLFDSQEERQESEKMPKLSYLNSNHIHSVWRKNYAEGIVYVHLYYTSGKAEKRVKSKVRAFLNYRYAIVHKDEVVFSFTKRDLDIIAADKDTENSQDEKKIEKVMEKISNLLKFTEENGANEMEAIAASAKAQMLLAKYHLSLSDVTGEKQNKEDIMQVTAVAGMGKKWKYDLAVVVAKGYCCKTYFVDSDRIIFYGYETDALAARRIFVYLFNVGDKLASQYVRQNKEKPFGETRGVYNSFASGFIRGVDSKFQENCTALALVVQPEVEKSFNVFSEKFKEKNLSLKVSDMDWEAEEQGYIEGKRALTVQYLESGEKQT